MRTIADLAVAHKRVLLREDLNVPLEPGDPPRVLDATRIDAAVPTIRSLHNLRAKTIVLSHLGRPKGRPVSALSLEPVAKALRAALGLDVAFAHDCVGDEARAAVEALSDGGILLLENLRFHPEEERNDYGFARELAALGDCYVNDAFGTAHRAHASTEALAHLLPHAAGPLMLEELAALEPLLQTPRTPYVCAIGGAKVKDKIGVLSALAMRVNAFCVGGGMANTLLAAQGADVGKSLRDDDLGPARRILEIANDRGVRVHLPVDAVVAIDLDAPAKTARIGAIGDAAIFDIGPETVNEYASVVGQAQTIVFNGPMGVYERPAFRSGTKGVGEAIARATEAGATSVVGGGDAAAAAHLLGFADAMTHVSTGGGATLELLEGKTLPGVAALQT
ncbi:MAG: phosphoglycerate kinase [Candidatus Tyrphobacter sp.]